MKFEDKDNIIVINKEAESYEELAVLIDEQFSDFSQKNIIVNLDKEEVRPSSLIPFEAMANQYMRNKKSFVIVADIDFDEIDDALVVVPTLQEAFDLIEMDEIERDLGF